MENMKTLEELKNEAIEALENDDDLFCTMIDELDGWNGFADGFRCFPMFEIDELFSGCPISEFLDKLGYDLRNRKYGLSVRNISG